MPFYTGLLLLVIAVSLDGFGVGVTYGMRNIRVPVLALSIIMLCSGVIVFLSMTIGSMLSTFISPHHARMLGGVILIFLGLFSLTNIILPKIKAFHLKKPSKVQNKKAHIFKTILKKPSKADLDKSGVISANEALLLGSALALDAFGAGIGASMLNYPPLLTTLLIATMSGGFLFGGIKTGLFLSRNEPLQKLTFIPPFLLIFLGISNLF